MDVKDLKIGDNVELPNGDTMVIESFEMYRNVDGDPALIANGSRKESTPSRWLTGLVANWWVYVNDIVRIVPQG